MSDGAFVNWSVSDGIAEIEFYHPKKNSLPRTILSQLARTFDEIADSDQTRVIVLRSRGDGPFCAGASFDELLAVRNQEGGREFFMGFARVILAMVRCPKLIITRVQGKAVGGGVGLISASDYVIAHSRSAVKLSELALGLGPFVVGPCVERKVGRSEFAAMAVDTEWRDAAWALTKGLYHQVHPEIEELDGAVAKLAGRLAGSNPEAMASLKEVIWSGTEDWATTLPRRAAESGRLVVSDFTSRSIDSFREKARERRATN